MANDYRKLQGQVASDLSAAATSASLTTGGGKRKKVRVANSDIPRSVPSGATVTLESVALGKLHMGDVICVSLGQGPALRRFVRIKMTPTGDTLILTAYEGFGKKEALPKSSLVGKVVEAESSGKTWNPASENPFRRFWNQLTEYGTHRPFGLGKRL